MVLSNVSTVGFVWDVMMGALLVALIGTVVRVWHLIRADHPSPCDEAEVCLMSEKCDGYELCKLVEIVEENA